MKATQAYETSVAIGLDQMTKPQLQRLAKWKGKMLLDGGIFKNGVG